MITSTSTSTLPCSLGAEAGVLRTLRRFYRIRACIPDVQRQQVHQIQKTRLTMPRSRQSKSSQPAIDSIVDTLQDYQISSNPMASASSRGQVSIATPSPITKLKPQRSTPEKKLRPSKQSGGIPEPTPAYLALSEKPLQPLPQPQHLLVVIDLNGTILFRPRKKQPTHFTARPLTNLFLKYCVDTFSVVIWSSARPENVNFMCNAIFTKEQREKVIAVWGRDKLGLSPKDYDLSVQCYKRLTKLWNDPEIFRSHPGYASGARWDQTNTVLVDDSIEKGRSEPFNLIEIPEFFGDMNEKYRILPQVHDYLNHLSMHSNVSACLRSTPFKPRLS